MGKQVIRDKNIGKSTITITMVGTDGAAVAIVAAAAAAATTTTTTTTFWLKTSRCVKVQY